MTYSNANFKIRIEFRELLHQFFMKTLVCNSLIKEQSLRNNSVFSVGRCSPRCRFILFFLFFSWMWGLSPSYLPPLSQPVQTIIFFIQSYLSLQLLLYERFFFRVGWGSKEGSTWTLVSYPKMKTELCSVQDHRHYNKSLASTGDVSIVFITTKRSQNPTFYLNSNVSSPISEVRHFRYLIKSLGT